MELRGAEVCIINHSMVVGKPLATMCINRDATMTVCHEHTRDVRSHTLRADVVVTGTGGHRRLTPDVWDKAAWVTPVPGGVGPMTIAVLL